MAGGREPTWTVVAVVAQEALRVGQLPRGGDLGAAQHQRLLVEHAGMHEDEHEDRGQAVGLGRHPQRVVLGQGGGGVQRESADGVLPGGGGQRRGVDVWQLGSRLADLVDQVSCGGRVTSD